MCWVWPDRHWKPVFNEWRLILHGLCYSGLYSPRRLQAAHGRKRGPWKNSALQWQTKNHLGRYRSHGDFGYDIQDQCWLSKLRCGSSAFLPQGFWRGRGFEAYTLGNPALDYRRRRIDAADYRSGRHQDAQRGVGFCDEWKHGCVHYGHLLRPVELV